MAGPRHVVDLLKRMSVDFHRGNMFEVELYPPVNLDNLTLTQNMVKQVSIPGFSLREMEITRMGQQVTVPTGIVFDKITMKLHDDSESKIRTCLLKWQELHYGKDIAEGVFEPNLASLLKGRIEIFQLDSNHVRTTQTTAYHAWPMTVGDIDLNHESEDTILDFNVSIAYSYAKQTLL